MTTVRMDICIIHYTSSMLMNIQHLCDVVTYMYCGIMQNFTPLPSVEGYSSKAWGDMLIKIQNNANIHQAACIINYWRLYLRPNTHGTGGHLTSSHGRRVARHTHPPEKNGYWAQLVYPYLQLNLARKVSEAILRVRSHRFYAAEWTKTISLGTCVKMWEACWA